MNALREKDDPFDLMGAAREACDLLADLVTEQTCSAEVPGYGVTAAVLGSTQHRLANAIALAAPLAKRVWTASELADTWKVSVSLVRGWIEDGDLAAFNVGRGSVPHWRITGSEALRFADLRKKRERGAGVNHHAAP